MTALNDIGVGNPDGCLLRVRRCDRIGLNRRSAVFADTAELAAALLDEGHVAVPGEALVLRLPLLYALATTSSKA